MARTKIPLSDHELMKKVRQNPNGRKHSISTLPEHLKEIAQAAAKYGVVINPDGTWNALTKEPLFKDLRSHVGGYAEVVDIPSQGKAKTIFVVNEEGKIKDMPPNPIASYFTLQAIVGTVVWLPKEYVK